MPSTCCPNCGTRIIYREEKTTTYPKTYPRKGNASWKLLEAFATYPDKAMSDQESYEVAQEMYPEFTSRNYWQKVSHLIELGFVQKVGKRVTPSGGWGRVCRVTEAGRRLLSS